jgi:acyl-CoA dehydrogenase
MMIHLPFFEERHRQLYERLRTHSAVFDALAFQGETGVPGDLDAAGQATIRECAEHGLCRLLVPREFGGDGLDLRSLCITREWMAGLSGLADAVFAVQGLGSYPIGLSGNRALSERLLPEVAEGRAIAAFALTELEAGSDAGALTTRAVREGSDYILDGGKIFITNATIATFFVVFARTAEGPSRAISAFVVEAGTPGLTIARRQDVMAPHPLAELRLSSCRVPAAQRLGEEGDGMRLALGTLDFFRTSVGAAACGLAGRALTESRSRATSRRQFGSALADFQMTQGALADMATELEAARLLVYRAAWLKDQGQPRLTRESAMAKLFATEAAQRIVDRAVQIHGGCGVERGSVVERLYREVRPLRIYEGTSEIQRVVIARQVLEGS